MFQINLHIKWSNSEKKLVVKEHRDGRKVSQVAATLKSHVTGMLQGGGSSKNQTQVGGVAMRYSQFIYSTMVHLRPL